MPHARVCSQQDSRLHPLAIIDGVFLNYPENLNPSGVGDSVSALIKAVLIAAAFLNGEILILFSAQGLETISSDCEIVVIMISFRLHPVKEDSPCSTGYFPPGCQGLVETAVLSGGGSGL